MADKIPPKPSGCLQAVGVVVLFIFLAIACNGGKLPFTK